MKRKTKMPGMVRYKKINGGSFHTTINGRVRIIKPGEIFDARPEEIPTAFLDSIIRLDSLPERAHKNPKPKVEEEVPEEEPEDEIPEEEPEEGPEEEPEEEPEEVPEEDEVPGPDAKYYIKQRPGIGFWDVLDANGKPQNEKALRKEDAVDLLDELLD